MCHNLELQFIIFCDVEFFRLICFSTSFFESATIFHICHSILSSSRSLESVLHDYKIQLYIYSNSIDLSFILR